MPRPAFVHYDKEEASDVEISLESDSDDSVVIVPEGLPPLLCQPRRSQKSCPQPRGLSLPLRPLLFLALRPSLRPSWSLKGLLVVEEPQPWKKT